MTECDQCCHTYQVEANVCRPCPNCGHKGACEVILVERVGTESSNAD